MRTGRKRTRPAACWTSVGLTGGLPTTPNRRRSMTDRYERTRDPAEGRAITAVQVTLFGRECFLPADIAQEVEQACAAHGRTSMTTNTMGRDEAVRVLAALVDFVCAEMRGLESK